MLDRGRNQRWSNDVSSRISHQHHPRGDALLCEAGHIRRDHGQADGEVGDVDDKQVEADQLTSLIGAVGYQHRATQADQTNRGSNGSPDILERTTQKRAPEREDWVNNTHGSTEQVDLEDGEAEAEAVENDAARRQ